MQIIMLVVVAVVFTFLSSLEKCLGKAIRDAGIQLFILIAVVVLFRLGFWK